jgi:competence protein ComEC
VRLLSDSALAVLLAVLALHAPILPPRDVTLLLMGGVLLLVLVLGVARRIRASRGIVLVLLAWVPLTALHAGAAWQDRQLPESCEGMLVTLDGFTRGLPRSYARGAGSLWRVELELADIRPGRCAGPRRVQLYIDSASARFLDAAGSARTAPWGVEGPEAGTRLRGEARLRRPWGQVNPGARTGERRFLVEGLHAVGSLRTLQPESARSSSASAVLDRLRGRVSRWVRDSAPPATAGLLAALAVGDQRFMDEAAWNRLRVFGLTHLLVISGMHISLAALPGWWLGGALVRLPGTREPTARLLPPVLALLCSGFYAALAGFSLPTRRALLMLVLLAVPRLLGRQTSLATSLAAAVLILLLFDPLAVLGTSFWLSVGAVSLLGWYLAWRPRQRGARRLFGIQLFLIAAMAPLALAAFGSTSTLGALCNLLAIPVVSLWIAPLLLASLVARSISGTLARILIEAASQPLEILWQGLEHAEALAASFQLRLAPPPQALWPLLAGACLLLLPRLPRRFVLSSLLLLPVLAFLALRPAPRFEMVVFDVGQGLAVLARSGSASLLVDTGPAPPGGIPVAVRTVLPALRRLGLSDLTMLVISHPDSDHDGGERRVRKEFPPGEIRRGVAARGSRERCRAARREVLAEGLEIVSLGGAGSGDSDNNASCILLLESGGYRFLLPGDIDTRRERELVAYWSGQLKADVLLAGHHGSGGSTSRLWLRHVRPRHLVVAAGRANRFGHPAPRVLAAARDAGARVLNTAYDGALIYRITADGQLRCRRLRHRGAPFWRRGDHAPDCGPAAVRTPRIIP